MHKTLVTGATGFIGSHLIDALCDRGHPVVCLARPGRDAGGLERPGVTVHRGDLLSPKSLAGCCEGVGTVYHLGACPDLGARASRDLEVNTAGTVNLLREASRSGGVGRFILMSSLVAAGRPPGQRLRPACDGPAPAPPDTPYGRSKRQAEIAVQNAGIPYVILRPGVVYGPRSRPSAGMNALLQAVRNRRLISRFDLPGRISVIYVKDLVRACLLAAGHPSAVNRTFFVAYHPPVTFGDIFRTARRLLGLKQRPNRIGRGVCCTADAAYNLLDLLLGVSRLVPSYLLAPISASLACESTALQKRLGFRPQYPLRLGLAQTLRA